jgi:hypothetical protein
MYVAHVGIDREAKEIEHKAAENLPHWFAYLCGGTTAPSACPPLLHPTRKYATKRAEQGLEPQRQTDPRTEHFFGATGWRFPRTMRNGMG